MKANVENAFMADFNDRWAFSETGIYRFVCRRSNRFGIAITVATSDIWSCFVGETSLLHNLYPPACRQSRLYILLILVVSLEINHLGILD